MHDTSLSIPGQHGPSPARFWARRIVAGLIAVSCLYIFGVGLVTVAAQWSAVV